MHLVWDAEENYDEIGGREVLEAAVRDALAHAPREHLRLLDDVMTYDSDPRGVALGVYIQDHRGTRIELYLRPHVLDSLRLPPAIRPHFLRLHLAHTLFHEIGHHVTLKLNRRREPSKRKGEVSLTLEKWAEEYVEKRMAKYMDAQKIDGDAGFDAARKYFEKPSEIGAGTKKKSAAS